MINDTVQNKEFDYLYPDILDPHFNIKIAKKKEFYDTQYDGAITDIEKEAIKLCNLDFEIMPHQLFVKNFLSSKTPYNSLFLYHGLGSGKTCSAIGIAEEMRSYMKQIGLETNKTNKFHRHIIIIASPNVQTNFKLQLFDESKLKIDNTGTWNISSCVGKDLLKEINPTFIKTFTKEQIIDNINKIIQSAYSFFGYIAFSNHVTNIISPTEIEQIQTSTEEMKIQQKNHKIKKYFNNRLIIIDEVHNIRDIAINANKDVSKTIFDIIKVADNIRLLLLSATPMYNSYKEIIWITNLLNLNDRRPIIRTRDVFDNDGNFQNACPEKKQKCGYSLLKSKLNGYISYIRGENPYTFPFRIYPSSFDPENFNEFKNKKPTRQFNTILIQKNEQLQFIEPFLTILEKNNYQEKYYLQLIQSIITKTMDDHNEDEVKENKYGYAILRTPIQALNMVYPSNTDNHNNCTGSDGLKNAMNYQTDNDVKYNFKYNNIDSYNRFFQLDYLKNYSSKIHYICKTILTSIGTIMIYSEFIDGGLLPMALALEELGFKNYNLINNTNRLLSSEYHIEPIDALQLKIKDNIDGTNFNQASYIMITGDTFLSQNNTQNLEIFNSKENKNGEKIKVILISKAGAEGIDYKNIRQLHILEPWYNLNRIEQIIGRTVRNFSHCHLPFNQRNVQIYLHATTLTNTTIESVDLYIYRLAQKKALKIAKITRLLKETSVDCILNIKQHDFTVEKLNKIKTNQNIHIILSNKKQIKFDIGDKPFTQACDYMTTCEILCHTSNNNNNNNNNNIHTYQLDHTSSNRIQIIEKIKQLFREKHFYNRTTLIQLINLRKPYPIEHIYSTLHYLVDNKNETIIDIYNRLGTLQNKDNIYMFQPLEINDSQASLFDRSVPILYNHDQIGRASCRERVLMSV